MFCEKCGAKIDDDALFCPKCGNQLDLTDNESQNEDKIHVEKTNSQDAHTPESHGKQLRGTYIMAITAIVLLTAACVLIFVIKPGSGTDKDTIEVADTTESSESIEPTEFTEPTESTEESSYEGIDIADTNPSIEESDPVIEDSEANVKEYVENIDVEAEVESIRSKYNDITNLIQNNSYDEIALNDDVTVYMSDNIEAIFVNKGYDENEYSRKYYFSDGKLIFAYFEANDAHRLYFKNDNLFRWRYSANASEAQNAINHDGDNADGYDQIEEQAINEAYSIASIVQNMQ